MKSQLFWGIGVCTAISGFAAPFQNLDFESANTNHLVPCGIDNISSGPLNELLPGWQVKAPSPGHWLNNQLWLNVFAPGPGFFSLFDRNYHPDLRPIDRFPVYGNFSFAMNPDFGPFSLSQVGDVPVGVSAISFVSYERPVSLFIDSHAIALDSVEIPVEPFVEHPRFQVTADVSEFAGKEVELKFVTGNAGWYGLDNITFLSVPEPSTWALIACGSAVVCGNLFRRTGRPGKRWDTSVGQQQKR